jgi:hypothetical protein
MTVTVGLGTGNKQAMLGQIMSILGVQQQALQIGVATPQNIYEACMELTKNAGFKDGDKYWTNPVQQQQQEPQPDPKVIEAQMKNELENKKLQQKAENDQATLLQKQEAQSQNFYLGMQQLLQQAEEANSKRMLELTKMVEEIQLETKRMGMDFVKHQSSEQNKIDSISRDSM